MHATNDTIYIPTICARGEAEAQMEKRSLLLQRQGNDEGG